MGDALPGLVSGPDPEFGFLDQLPGQTAVIFHESSKLGSEPQCVNLSRMPKGGFLPCMDG